MSRTLAVFVGAIAGALVGMQPAINARLGRSVGTFQAASVSFLVGTVFLLVITVFTSGGLQSIGHVSRVPWWALTGGLLGAIYVAISLVAVRTLGAGGIAAAVITGQLAVSVAVDRFGLFGLTRQPIHAHRIVGLVLLVAGAALVVRK
jgi:bacterial/archaeal transporter family-2 protein